MKFLESDFISYINEVNKYNLHGKKYENYYNKTLPKNIKDLNNIILYGPKGIGKYSQALKIISKYSNSNLNYEKKMVINIQDKFEYIVKLSDIHYEINMELLGCNSKHVWNEIYNQIIESTSIKKDKYCILLCKNFEKINSELLDIFYEYMKDMKDVNNDIFIKYIFITTNISFIPSNILKCCNIINYSRPSKHNYEKIVNKELSSINMNDIINIKDIKILNNEDNNKNKQQNIYVYCDKIIDEFFVTNIANNNPINFIKLREYLYDLLIYNFNIYQCICYILNRIYNIKKLNTEQLYFINIELFKFFKYYNNNYRPIFHLERFILYLLNVTNTNTNANNILKS
jgi:hypothetical protein